jgi:DeoR family transcriptional regulator of aga operon
MKFDVPKHRLQWNPNHVSAYGALHAGVDCRPHSSLRCERIWLPDPALLCELCFITDVDTRAKRNTTKHIVLEGLTTTQVPIYSYAMEKTKVQRRHREKVMPIAEKTHAMLIGERQQYILSLLQQNGRVLVSELSESLGISSITIRKDLDRLELQGLVQRTHGGALSPHGSMIADPTLQEKSQHQVKEKQRIASAAAGMVREGQCVLLDSGTTVMMIAKALRQFSNLTIVTNAVNIAIELSDTGFEIVLVGGALRKNSFSLVGPLAEDVLQQIHADILFLGVDGFDTRVGITTPNMLESRVNRAMVRASRKVVAVCDSTKFSRSSMAVIMPTSAVQTVITDDQIGTSDLDALKSAGIEVITV